MRLRDLEGISKLDAFRWDWHEIQPDPDNDLRDLTTPENRAHIERLKDSLSIGWRQGESMLVRIEQETSIVYAVDGRCRLTALAELEAEGRPFPSKVTLLQEQSNTERPKRVLAMLSSGTDRKNLSDKEFARGLYKAMELGYTEKELCAEMGWKTVATLNNHLAVLTLKPELAKMVDEGKISRTEALRLSKMTDADPGEIMRLAEEEHKRLNKKGPVKAKPRHVKAATKPKSDPKPEPEKHEAPKMEGTKPEGFIGDELHETQPGGLTLDQLREYHRAPEGATATDLPSGLPATSETQPAFSPLSDETPPKPEPMFRDEGEAPPVHPQLQSASERERPPVREFPAPAFAKPRDGVEGLLLKFLNADVVALATMYRNLCREQEEAAVNGGATQAQYQLPVAADVIGVLRFPDQWEQAKGNSELAEVA